MKSKQCLDVQQMQHLQELGIRMELYTTLFCYVKFEDTDWLLKPISDLSIIGISFYAIPAYTLQDVLDALPKNIYREYIGWTKLEIQAYSEAKYVVGYRYIDTCDKYIVYRDGEELIDAAYSMLCWAIENGYVETNKTSEL